MAYLIHAIDERGRLFAIRAERGFGDLAATGALFQVLGANAVEVKRLGESQTWHNRQCETIQLAHYSCILPEEPKSTPGPGDTNDDTNNAHTSSVGSQVHKTLVTQVLVSVKRAQAQLNDSQMSSRPRRTPTCRWICCDSTSFGLRASPHLRHCWRSW